MVERRAEAEHLRRHGVDVAGLLQRGLQHPEDREEHDHGEQREQRDLETGAEPSATADRRSGGLARDARVRQFRGLDVGGHRQRVCSRWRERRYSCEAKMTTITMRIPYAAARPVSKPKKATL